MIGKKVVLTNGGSLSYRFAWDWAMDGARYYLRMSKILEKDKIVYQVNSAYIGAYHKMRRSVYQISKKQWDKLKTPIDEMLLFNLQPNDDEVVFDAGAILVEIYKDGKYSHIKRYGYHDEVPEGLKAFYKAASIMDKFYHKGHRGRKVYDLQKELDEREKAEKEKRQKEFEEKQRLYKQKALWRDAKNRIMESPDFFKDVNADIFNDQGETPLIVAAKHKNEYFISQELSQAKVTVRLKDRYGKTAYDYIPKPHNRTEEIYTNRTKQALMILEVYQIIRSKAEMVGYSIRKDRFRITIKGAECSDFHLPDFVSECHSVEKINKERPTLITAIMKHDHQKLDALLQNGADTERVSKYDQNGFTPLFYAVSQGDKYAIETLLVHGANMYATDAYNTYNPFTWAASGGDRDIDIVKLFLRYGADVNYQYKKSETALTVAAKGCKNFELVKLLLENGADPEKIDRYGNTTFTSLEHYCRDKERYKKMKALIESYIK
jgi:ankyrin repeat protein